MVILSTLVGDQTTTEDLMVPTDRWGLVLRLPLPLGSLLQISTPLPSNREETLTATVTTELPSTTSLRQQLLPLLILLRRRVVSGKYKYWGAGGGGGGSTSFYCAVLLLIINSVLPPSRIIASNQLITYEPFSEAVMMVKEWGLC